MMIGDLGILWNLADLYKMLPKHKYLITYRYAEIIHDLTVEFSQRFIISILGNLSNLGHLPKYRTIDQMVQAARSGN